MSGLTQLEESIYNEGERLIPGVTHDFKEVRRHYSSYYFWRDAILMDLAQKGGAADAGPIRVVDLGCGVGHGCASLSEIPGVEVVGVDMSEDSLRYARQNYNRPNIQWLQADLPTFIREMDPFDYVVSRGVIEHIENGIEFVHGSNWKQRLMFDVPYDEPAGVNPHHVISEIREETFEPFQPAELFFQDLEGEIFSQNEKPPRPNMIICCCRAEDLKPLNAGLSFPYMPDWQAVGGYAVPEAPAEPSRKTLKDRLFRLFGR